MAFEFTVDIEVHDPDDGFSQAKYLVHGVTDVTWTNDLNEALAFLKMEILDNV